MEYLLEWAQLFIICCILILPLAVISAVIECIWPVKSEKITWNEPGDKNSYLEE